MTVSYSEEHQVQSCKYGHDRWECEIACPSLEEALDEAQGMIDAGASIFQIRVVTIRFLESPS